MPFVYTLGFRPATPWAADDWHPAPGFDWAMAVGTPLSEFMWGSWLWLALLLSGTAAPPHPPRRPAVWFEAVVAAFQALFLGSCVYYATVKQNDTENFTQTLVGLVLSTAALLLLQVRAVYLWRQRGETPSQPLLGDDGDEGSELSDMRLDGQAPRPQRLCRRWEWLFPRGTQPRAFLLSCVGLLSVLASATVLVMACVVLPWNWSTPRYCNMDTSPSCVNNA